MPLKKRPETLPEKEFIALFALMISLSTLSVDSMLPAFPHIAESLEVDDYQKTQWIVSVLIFGVAFGEIMFGPLSDAIGRKKSILIGVGIYIVGTLLAVLATSSSLLICALFYNGVPPFPLFMALGMVMISCVGMVFGNVNAMAMEPLGKTAGLGTSIISSLSSLFAILLSVIVGQFYHFTITPFAGGFMVFSMLALGMLFILRKSNKIR